MVNWQKKKTKKKKQRITLSVFSFVALAGLENKWKSKSSVSNAHVNEYILVIFKTQIAKS